MFKNLFVLYLAIIFGLSAFAQQETSLTGTVPDSSVPQKDQQANYFTIGYKTFKSSRYHAERAISGNTQRYLPLNQESSLNEKSLEFGFAREINNGHQLSFTPFVKAGLMSGSDKGEGALLGSEMAFKDKLKGISYGAGLSLNANFSVLRVKMQPFISGAYLGTMSKYRLKYETKTTQNNDVTTDEVLIRYDNNATFLQASLGVRFFDYKESLMSYLSFDYLNDVKSDDTIKAKNNGAPIKLGNIKEIEYKSYALSIGFGFIF